MGNRISFLELPSLPERVEPQRTPSSEDGILVVDQQHTHSSQTAAILQLPTELLSYILTYLVSLLDLRRLCLTCKALHAAVLPLLYHNMTVTSSGIDMIMYPHPRRLNPGLAHIRHLRILTMQLGGHAWRHWPDVARLLTKIPRDCLRTFACDSYKAPIPDKNIIEILLSRQRQLINHVVYHAPRHSPNVPVPTRQDLSNVAALSVYLPTVARDRERAAATLRNAPHVKSLAISSSRDTPFTEVWEEAATQALFEPWLVSCRDQKLGLRHLMLSGLEMDSSARHCAEALCPETLETLILMDCIFSNTLFALLAPLKLKLKTCLCLDIYPKVQLRGRLQDLIESVSGLQYLRISGYQKVKSECSWQAISQHSESLCALYLDTWENGTDSGDAVVDWYLRQLQSFKQLTIRCKGLRQLAIRIPSSIETSRNDTTGLQDFVECIKNLRYLVTLRLVMHYNSILGEFKAFCRSDGSESCDAPAAPEAKVLMQEFANQIFYKLAASCPSFSALQMDVEAVPDSRYIDQHENYAYLRDRRLDEHSRLTIKGRACSVAELATYVPHECDILNDRIRIVDDFWRFRCSSESAWNGLTR